jgi:hypothetical protein
MLADGHAAAQRGVDVVVAYFEPHARPDTIRQTQGLEIVPHRKIEYRGKTFEEMDTEAVCGADQASRWSTNWSIPTSLARLASSVGKTLNFCRTLSIEVCTTMNVHVWKSLPTRRRPHNPGSHPLSNLSNRPRCKRLAGSTNKQSIWNRLKEPPTKWTDTRP